MPGGVDPRPASKVGLPRVPSLSPTLTADGRLAFPLPLRAGLLIEAALAELRIETRPLYFALEPAECPLEALVILDGDFQEYHAPLQKNFRAKN